MLSDFPLGGRGLSQLSVAGLLVLRGGGPENSPWGVSGFSGLAARKQSKSGWYPESREACSQGRQWAGPVFRKGL